MPSRPGYYFCVCPDIRLMRDHVAEQLAAHAPDSGTRWARHVFWGDDPLPGQFWECLTLQGLFDAPKAIIVNNAQDIPAEVWKRLSAALSRPRGAIWPFFCLAVAFEKRGTPKVPAHISKLPCYSFAGKQKWLWSSPGLQAGTKPAFVRREAERLRLSFAPGAFEAISPHLALDAAAIVTEMEKLALAAGEDGVLQPEHARLLVSNAEYDIFKIISALQEGGNLAPLWQRISLQYRGDDSQIYNFLALLVREGRDLWQILAGEIPERLPQYVVPVKKRLAASLGFAGVARLWHLALEADKGIKSGERNNDQAMECLMAGLYALFARKKQGNAD